MKRLGSNSIMFDWEKVRRDLLGFFAVAAGLATALAFCLTLTLSERMSFGESLQEFWMLYLASLLSITGGILHIMGRHRGWLVLGIFSLIVMWIVVLGTALKSWS